MCNFNDETKYGPKWGSEEETCCGKFVRLILGVMNFVTLLVGAGQIGLGIYIEVTPEWSFAAGTLSLFMIITGCVLFIISFLGICAVCKGSRADGWMYIFAILITIVFGLQIAALVMAAVDQTEVLEKFVGQWDKLEGSAKDAIGLYFGCCQVVDEEAIGTDKDGNAYGGCGDWEWDQASDDKKATRFLTMTGDGTTCGMYPLCYNKDCTHYTFSKLASEAGCPPDGDNADTEDFQERCSCPACGADATDLEDCAIDGDNRWVASEAGSDGNADSACTALIKFAEMPYCSVDSDTPASEDRAMEWGWYAMMPDADATTRKEVSVDLNVDNALANCYGKGAQYAADNKMAFVGAAIGFLIWQILLAVFSWLLACDACNKKHPSQKGGGTQMSPRGAGHNLR